MKYYIFVKINEDWAILNNCFKKSAASDAILFTHGLNVRSYTDLILINGRMCSNTFITYGITSTLRINHKIDYQKIIQIGFNTFKECNEQCHLTKTNLNKTIREKVKINHWNQFRVTVKPISYTKLKQILEQAKDRYSDGLAVSKSSTASKLTAKKVALRNKQFYENRKRIYK